MAPRTRDVSVSGESAPLRRRHLRLRRHRRPSRSPSPPSPTGGRTSHELTPPSSAASAAASASPSSSYLSSPVLPSYVAVAPLPVFRGDPVECPVAHLARFDRACQANNAADSATAARIFPASLDVDAALWYEVNIAPLASPPPWHVMRAAFLDFFRPPGAADLARAELMSLRQRPGESVNRYHLRMQGVLRRCPDHVADVPDGFLKGVFVDGLREDYQDWVVPQRPETLEEAVALAASWERAESLREAQRKAKAAAEAGDKCGFCGGEGHKEGGCEVRRRMRELWARSGSLRGSLVGRREEEEEGGSRRLSRLGSAVSTRSSAGQCQCRKHQCGRKAEAGESAGGGEGVAPASLAAEAGEK